MHHIITLIRRYSSIQNAGLLVAGFIVLGWVWGTVGTLQRNFNYQRQVDELTQSAELDKLRNENLRFQQVYLRSDEYLELSARQRLNKAAPGENLIILPDSRGIKDTVADTATPVVTTQLSNMDQWLRFFFGGQSS